MGCMARKILAPGSSSNENSDEAEGAGATSAGGKKNKKDKSSPAASVPPQSPPMGPKSTDELGDFSKLEDDPRLPLNKRQIFKITKSWKAIARTMSKTGTAMFLNLFEQNRDLLYLFDRFQHLKGRQELHESMELREHAATVMSTLDQSINSLSDYDNFVTYLYSIGQLHRKVPGFKRDFFWVSTLPSSLYLNLESPTLMEFKWLARDKEEALNLHELVGIPSGFLRFLEHKLKETAHQQSEGTQSNITLLHFDPISLSRFHFGIIQINFRTNWFMCRKLSNHL